MAERDGVDTGHDGTDTVPDEHRPGQHRADDHRPGQHRADEQGPEGHSPGQHRVDEHRPEGHRPDDIHADRTAPTPATGTAEQPWHPFELPSWLDASADPRLEATGGVPGIDGADFMGVSRWDGEEAEVVEERRRPWLLGALAGVAVIIVLAVVAFFALRSGSVSSPGPDAGTAIATVPVIAPDTDLATPPVDTAVVPTVTSAGPTTTAPVTADASGTDPLGGPERDIACAAGFVVQVASGGDEPSFIARVAELRAADQLPADTAVARTASSCAIFAGLANSIVLYTGPYTGQYDGCQARLAGAPDSFIKGTTPKTATTYVSCLCPVQVVTVPTVDAIGRTGVWIGELQRILGNRLNIPIPDLQGNWGTFTDGTSAAVRTFQTGAGLSVTGTVDAGTWQALQKAQC